MIHQWLLGMELRHSVENLQRIFECWWLSGCSTVLQHWWLKPSVLGLILSSFSLASSTLCPLPQSCPAIQVYSAKNLDSALTQAACSFCSQEVTFDPTQKQVTLSKIFVWYSSDFGDTENDVLR